MSTTPETTDEALARWGATLTEARTAIDEADALVARIAAEHAECFTIEGARRAFTFASTDLPLTRRTAAQRADEISGLNGATGHVLIQYWLAGQIVHTEHVYGPTPYLAAKVARA